MARRRTVVIATAAVLLGFGALLAAGIALLTQTDRGLAVVRSALIPTIAAAMSGRVHVGAIHGTLFTSLTIDSLEVREPNGAPFLNTGRITITYDPRDLLERQGLEPQEELQSGASQGSLQLHPAQTRAVVEQLQYLAENQVLEVDGVVARVVVDERGDQEVQMQWQRSTLQAVRPGSPVGRIVEREFLALDQIEPQRNAFLLVVLEFLRRLE